MMSNLYLRIAVFISIVIANPFHSFVFGQGTIEGIVIDAETSKAVPYASVELLKSEDSLVVKAVTVDIEGKFRISNVPNDRYLIRISCLGYQKKVLPEFELSGEKPLIKIGSIALMPEAKSLNEVVVTGYKLTGVIQDNKTIYTVNAKTAEIAQSGLELLRQLPDITVNYFSDDVKLAGSSNILFQVNGRKVDNNYLMQLNPGLVDKIEVIHNPGANYDGAVDAVINIILKRKFQYGIAGQVRIQVPTSRTILSKNNANVDIYHQKFRFYVAARYKMNDYAIENSNKRTTFTPDTYLNQKSNGKEKGSSISANYGFDWFINNNNALSVYNSIQPGTSNNANFKTDNTYFEEKTTYHIGVTTKTDKNDAYEYSLFFLHQFPQKGHQISFENYWSTKKDGNSDYYDEQEYKNSPLYYPIQNQFTESKNSYTYLKVDYTIPLTEKLTGSAGYNWYLLKKNFSYNDLVSAYTDAINYKENRHAVYLSLSSNISKLNIQAGVRYEFSGTNIIHEYDTINRYNYFLPTLTANYKLNEKNLIRMNYRKSIGRPGIDQLSPVTYKDDSYTWSKGNPNLKPSVRNCFEIEHRIQLNKSMYISYRPYLSLIKDGINQVNLFVSDSTLCKQYRNVNNELEYGILFSGLLSVKDIWTTTPSFTFFRKKLEALPANGINEDVKSNSWRFNITSQLILPKEWILFLELNYEAPTIDYQSKKHEYYDFIFGFSKTYNKKFTISAFTLNPLNNRYIYDKRTFRTESMIQDTESSIKYNYLFFIRLAYKFKSGKAGKKNNWDVENEPEQSQKKGILN